MKGAEQLARRGRPLAPRGSGRASGETRARGQKGSLPRSMRSAGLGGGEVHACAAAPPATARGYEQCCFLPALCNVRLSAT